MKVYCIGMGQVSAVGTTLKDFQESIQNEKKYIARLKCAHMMNVKAKYGAEIKNIPDKDKLLCIAKHAMMYAVQNSELDKSFYTNNKRVGFVFGSSLGDITKLEEASKSKDLIENLEVKKGLIADISYILRKKLNIIGPSYTISNTCATGITAISVAKHLIENGVIDICVVGCADILSNFILSGMSSMKALSLKDRLQPFSDDRDGMILGDGAAFIILANEKYGNKKACIMGASITNDGVHLSAPDKEAKGMIQSIKESLAYANLNYKQIDCIFACGTGTVYNDAMQAKAIKEVWNGTKCPVTTIKPYIGHTLATSGIIECIGMIIMLQNNFITSIGEQYISNRDAGNINLLHIHENRVFNNAILLSSGFSGVNASLILGKG